MGINHIVVDIDYDCIECEDNDFGIDCFDVGGIAGYVVYDELAHIYYIEVVVIQDFVGYLEDDTVSSVILFLYCFCYTV